MRDPARIDRMIEKLRTAWHSSPDLRLGQLLSVVMYQGYGNVGFTVFTLEDDVTERGLDELIAMRNKLLED